MKALIRNKKETITEDMKLPWIDWHTGMPLTNPDWCGGAYTLIEKYIPPAEEERFINPDPDKERTAEIAELKARLAAIENDL